MTQGYGTDNRLMAWGQQQYGYNTVPAWPSQQPAQIPMPQQLPVYGQDTSAWQQQPTYQNPYQQAQPYAYPTYPSAPGYAPTYPSNSYNSYPAYPDPSQSLPGYNNQGYASQPAYPSYPSYAPPAPYPAPLPPLAMPPAPPPPPPAMPAYPSAPYAAPSLPTPNWGDPQQYRQPQYQPYQPPYQQPTYQPQPQPRPQYQQQPAYSPRPQQPVYQPQRPSGPATGTQVKEGNRLPNSSGRATTFWDGHSTYKGKRDTGNSTQGAWGDPLLPTQYFCALPVGLHGGANWWHNQKILITNPSNGKQVVVQVQDKGPAPWTHNVVDLSPVAKEALGVNFMDNLNVQIAFADNSQPVGPVR